MNTYRSERSSTGISLSVLKSALQKYIRRGHIEKACKTWAALKTIIHPDATGTDADRKRVTTNIYNRLRIIAMEDISMSDIIIQTHECIENNAIDEFQLISDMCRSQKSRRCSHLRALGMFLLPEFDFYDLHLKYPKFASELEEFNTSQTLQLSDSLIKTYFCAQHLVNTKAKVSIQRRLLNSEKPTRRSVIEHSIFKMLSDNMSEEFQYLLSILEYWFTFPLRSTKERFLCWLMPLMEMYTIRKYGDILPNQLSLAENNLSQIPITQDELDDFCFDKHTGRREKKSNIKFALVGAEVSNECRFRTSKKLKTLYVDTKYMIDYGNNFSERMFKFAHFVQLVTSRGKQDTYFARYANELVVVKGPFRQIQRMYAVMDRIQIRKQLNLPYPKTYPIFMSLNTDIQVPLGVRNSFTEDRAWFLISKSLYPSEDIVTEIKSSKCWPPTVVMSLKDMDSKYHFDIVKFSEREMYEYVMHIYIRAINGAGDFADRNFIRNKHIYSVDEDSLQSSEISSLKTHLSPKRREYILQYLSIKENIFEQRIVEHLRTILMN